MTGQDSGRLGVFETGEKFYGLTRAVSVCTTLMVGRVFDAYPVNATLIPVCKELLQGLVVV
ncbi:MAG: hypothetical protein AB2692_21840 [Candidatus Thiodiazotropha sp.]